MEVLDTKTSLLRHVIMQYLPRFIRFIPLASEVKKTAGVFSENALLGAMYYLIWYMLASHVSSFRKHNSSLLILSFLK
jgi:cyclic nucleotide gated channel